MAQKLVSRRISKTRRRLLTFTALFGCGAAFYFLLNRLGFVMPISEIPSVLCLTSCNPKQPVHPSMEGEQLLNYQQSLQELLPEDDVEPEKVSILIEKSNYRLTVFYNLQPIKSYPVVLGSNPTGDKLHEGDRKTPEGIYHIRDLYPHPSWSKFIWLDYPTPQSWREHFRAKLEGKINWLLPIGGEIGIHGVPTGMDTLIEQRSNWTWGCPSLKNSDVDEIYQFVGRGSLVEIVP
ncbi:MAG: L,D-transpeptidase [Symploca sp. SIO2G7]|nr:L,D-transpeptidase [Symploca sp. SIO2G7]